MTPGARPSPFAHPEGLRGRAAARLMAIAGRGRSLEVQRRLRLGPGERVLEIGFGAGDDLARVLAAIGPDGRATGLDSSRTLVAQAARRFHQAVSQGRLSLRLASADDPLPLAAADFDKAFSINSFQFWAAPAATLGELGRVLAPGGLLVLAVQPKGGLARTTSPAAMLDRLSQTAAAAGFTVRERALCAARPRAVAIVEAVRPNGAPGGAERGSG